MSNNTEHNRAAADHLDTIGPINCLGDFDSIPGEAGEARVPDEISLVPEVVEIRLDYTKDAVQMAKGGCRRWK